jgi:DNA-3-methyladenine glycosylase I
MKKRCAWVTADPLYITYHDEEWGRPVHDDRQLFSMLNLEGQQAGLSWITVLKKREHYMKVFADFDPEKIALFDNRKIEHLLRDPGIIRNKLKIVAIISNAKAYLKFTEEDASFSEFLWSFAPAKMTKRTYASILDIPTKTPESDKMAKALKKMGFKFVGSTICHAFMQAVGMVNNHTKDCFLA